MKATVICHTARLQEELGRTLRAEGFEVAQALHRKGGEPLAGLLGEAEGDLLVVDAAAGSGEDDLAALAAFTAGHPAVPVVLLSPQRDSDTLLAAMRAGIREVLPTPPAADEFAASLRRIAQRTAGAAERPRGRVVAFVACKGGSGATFLATNLAYVLATEHQRRVALLDLDLQYGDAAYFVSDGTPRSNLAELARQVDRLDANLLEASMTQVAPNFSLLAAPEEPEAALGITGYQLERVLEVARDHHDFVILDVERMLDPLAIKGLDQAEAIYLVAENMIPHVRDARRLVRILHALGYPDSKLRLVVNRFDRREGLAIEQVEKVVGLKVARTITDSFSEVAEAVNTGVPLAKLHPHNAVTRALREIAGQLVAKPAGARGWLGRLIGAEH